MPRAFARFVERYPRIRVKYHTARMHTMAAEVLSNKVDLVVSVLPLEHPHLKVQTFARGRMVCVMPQGHELAGADIQRSRMGAAHHAQPENPVRQAHRIGFRRGGFELAPRIHVLQTEIAVSLVRAGAGLAIVDEYTAAGARGRA